MRWLALLTVLCVHPAFAETISGTVVTVIDGDTLVVQDASKKRHLVHLAEIDAPEPKQRFYVQSSRSLARLCLHKTANVEWSAREHGRYLGYVKCAGRDANAEQLRRGMAWGSPKSTQPTSGLYELEAYARLRRLGLWRDESPVAPWEFRAKK
jgi:endonuclease YncB( thermonuclease family)